MSGIIYILGTDEVNDKQVLLEAIMAASPKHKEVIMTAAQQLIHEGMQQGIQQGMQQGIEKRNIEVAKTMLQKGLDI